MGIELRPEHLAFFHARMNDHDGVKAVTPVEVDGEYVFTIYRERLLPSVQVHLTDAYRYGPVDYVARPSEIDRGSFVLMGMPHANYSFDLMEEMSKDGVGLGHIGKLMGALNFQNVWDYRTSEEKAWKADVRRRGRR